MKQQLKKRPARSKSVPTSRHLHVVQAKHTGHVLPKRHTSYSMLVMIVLCVGVFLASWTRYVAAAGPPPITNDYTVHASVPGPAPSTPATISSPANGAIFRSIPITVSGSCPVGTYVSLMRNNFASGVVLCDANGQYQMSMDLFPGINQLVAQDYSYTDVPGPASAPVTVSYNLPATTGSSVNLPTPLLLSSKFTFLGYYVGQAASWKVNITGGTAPYAVEVDWGDGNRNLLSQTTAELMTLTHTYSRTGGYHGSYAVKIYASDSQGKQAYLQLISIISNPPKGATSVSRVLPGGWPQIFNADGLGKLASYLWPSYGIVILMLISFWLGERRELNLLKPWLRKRPKTAH